jgi:hypothetical protein
MTAERGHPPSRPPAGPPPARGGPRRLSDLSPPGDDAARPGSQEGEGRGAPVGGEGSQRTPANGDRPRRAQGGGASPRRRPEGGGGSRPEAGSAQIEPVASRGPRRLAKPKPARVKADDTGRPQLIGKREVDAVRESWLVEDRWWTEEPLRRRYWEVVTGDGRDVVVFRDLIEGRWYAQR